MRSSFSYAAAATIDHDLSMPLSVLNDHVIPAACPQSVSDPPTYCIRASGVLRYSRESSNNNRTNITTILPVPQAPTECSVKCEYCGKKAEPSLNLTWLQEPETAPVFCCAQWQQLCEMLEKHKYLIEGRCDLTTAQTSMGDKPATETEEIFFQSREMEDHSKFIMDLPSGLKEPSELRLHEDFSAELPVTETGKGCWTVCPYGSAEKHLKIKDGEEQVLVPLCGHNPFQFGICHHQEGAGFLLKHYSSGMKFLTAFPDGSAQVLTVSPEGQDWETLFSVHYSGCSYPYRHGNSYPSGLLALVIVVTEENGRVCIVYDDSNSPNQPVRAVFQSDGRATCYHSNGNIRLTLNASGGQCFDDEGARVRRWSWSSLSLTPALLHPVFLALNKTIGVRVVGREQVFVSVLAKGQQTKFSVGACCSQDKNEIVGASSGPSVIKEELFALAAKVRLHLSIHHLQKCLMTPSYSRLPKTTQAPHLHVVAKRLLEASADVAMSDSERDFFSKCLQDCL